MPRGTDRYDEARFQQRLWTPNHLRALGKLYSWWDLSDWNTIAAVSSTNLTSVSDKSGFGINAATSSGDPGWTYPGADLRNTGTALLQNNNLPTTTFDFACVATTRSTAAVFKVLVKNPLSGQFPFILNASTTNIGVFDGAFKQAGSLAWPTATLGQAWLSLRSQTDARHGLNGSDLFSPAAHNLGTANLSHNIAGDGVTSGRGFGSLFEVIHMVAAMPDNLRQLVEGYLAWKWSNRLVHENVTGLTFYYDDLVGRLPASHPYKHRPPLL